MGAYDSSNQSFILPKKERKYYFDTTHKHSLSEKYQKELKYINNAYCATDHTFRSLAVKVHEIEKGQEKQCMDCGRTIYMGQYVTVERWNIKGRPKMYLYCPDCANGILGALEHVDTDYINYGCYPYDSFLAFRKTNYEAVDNYLDVLFQPRDTNARFIRLI